jgi:hypothetical protein
MVSLCVFRAPLIMYPYEFESHPEWQIADWLEELKDLSK